MGDAENQVIGHEQVGAKFYAPKADIRKGLEQTAFVCVTPEKRWYHYNPSGDQMYLLPAQVQAIAMMLDSGHWQELTREQALERLKH